MVTVTVPTHRGPTPPVALSQVLDLNSEEPMYHTLEDELEHRERAPLIPGASGYGGGFIFPPNATTYMPTQPNPSRSHQLGLWIRLCHIILTGECACAGDGGASGYGGGFIFPPNPGGSIGDMVKVVALWFV